MNNLTTGFQNIDNQMSSYRQNELSVIASRIGHGKTSFILSSIIQNTIDGHGVIYFTLDLTKKQLVQKLISIKTSTNLSDITENMIDSEIIQIDNDKDIFIDDSKYITIDYIIDKSTKLISMNNNIKMIVVDYLQLIENTDCKNIVRELKKLAIELNLSIVLLSQLNKKIEERYCRIPKLSDFDNDHIENEADSIFFIYVDDFYKEEREEQSVQNNKSEGCIYYSSYLNKPIVDVKIICAKLKNSILPDAIKLELHKNISKFISPEDLLNRG